MFPKSNRALRFRVVAAFTCLVVANLLGCSVPLIFQRIVDSMAAKGSTLAVLSFPLGLILCYFFVRLSINLCQELRTVLFSRVTYQAVRGISNDLFSHLHQLDVAFHVDRHTGGLARTVDRGTRAISFLMDSALFTTIPSILEIVLVCVFLSIRYGVAFGALSVFFVALYTWWTFTVMQWRIRVRERMNDLEENVSARLVDSVLNYETVKFFGNEALERRRYDRLLFEQQETAVLSIRGLSLLNFGQHFIGTAALTSLMFLTAKGVVAGRLSVGDLVAVNGLLTQMYSPLEYMGWAYREFKQSMIDIRNLIRVLELVPKVQELPDAAGLQLKAGRIEFRDVCFSYDPARPVLRGVSFTVEPGKTLAIVGPTGSGKSTILRMLYRFYDPSAGAILIDGQDIRSVSLASLRDSVGVVPQDCVLFNDTLAYNIAYGRPDCSPDDVREAARAAKLEQSIARMPGHYNTLVGERGAKLSGGEKQRVGIARIILKNPAILVLDEATSALDTATEQEIVQSLKELSEERTTVIVAHRLSTVAHADTIIVLDNGRVREMGTHAHLMADPLSRYARMWRQQAAEQRQDGVSGVDGGSAQVGADAAGGETQQQGEADVLAV